MSLLLVQEVSHSYGRRGGLGRLSKQVPVLSNISLSLETGACLGLLGSSGAGKSTLGKVVLGMERPQQGQVFFQGQDLYRMSASDRKRLRRDLQVVFQDCYSAVNPRMTVEQILGEPLDNYEKLSVSEQKRVIGEMLERVGLHARDMTKYPHQFSGGQLQRINIARAIVLKPKLIVLDESVSSLDMVNQAQIIQLLNHLKQSFRISYLFITHDIKAAFSLADQLAVMDQGQIIDRFDPKEKIFSSSHPGVRNLLQSVLSEHPANRKIRSPAVNPGVATTLT